MHGAVDQRRLAADVLQDVDFAAGRPPGGADVVAEHPERRPDTLAFGDLDARLEAAIGPARLALGQQARRGVHLAAQRFLARGDHQIAVAVERGVLRAVGVVLELGVAPAVVVAEIEPPLGRIDGGAVGPLELVAPDQPPSCRSHVTGIDGCIDQSAPAPRARSAPRATHRCGWGRRAAGGEEQRRCQGRDRPCQHATAPSESSVPVHAPPGKRMPSGKQKCRRGAAVLEPILIASIVTTLPKQWRPYRNGPHRQLRSAVIRAAAARSSVSLRRFS